jgi:hypothetical protein
MVAVLPIRASPVEDVAGRRLRRMGVTADRFTRLLRAFKTDLSARF